MPSPANPAGRSIVPSPRGAPLAVPSGTARAAIRADAAATILGRIKDLLTPPGSDRTVIDGVGRPPMLPVATDDDLGLRQPPLLEEVAADALHRRRFARRPH